VVVVVVVVVVGAGATRTAAEVAETDTNGVERVSTTRTVSVLVATKVTPVAPGTSVKVTPSVLTCHCHEVTPALVQVPLTAVRVWPTSGVPEMVGNTVADGVGMPVARPEPASVVASVSDPT